MLNLRKPTEWISYKKYKPIAGTDRQFSPMIVAYLDGNVMLPFVSLLSVCELMCWGERDTDLFTSFRPCSSRGDVYLSYYGLYSQESPCLVADEMIGRDAVES